MAFYLTRPSGTLSCGDGCRRVGEMACLFALLHPGSTATATQTSRNSELVIHRAGDTPELVYARSAALQ